MNGSTDWAMKAVFLSLGVVALAILLGLAMNVVQAIDAPPDQPSSTTDIDAYQASVDEYQDRNRWYSVFTALSTRLMDAALPLAVVALALAALGIAKRPAPPAP